MDFDIRIFFLAAACGFTLTRAQYGTSSSSYGSPSSSSSYGSPSSSISSVSSVSYPSINLPLLSIPVTVGNATLGISSNTSTTSTSSTNASATNYLATLPASAITNLSPPAYLYGTYPNDYDASRDSYYNHSTDTDIYPLNIYTNPVQGIGGALNLSNAIAVSAAQFWAPYPYKLAMWNDGYTTTQSSATASSTTLASGSVTVSSGSTATVATGTVVNASLYYAAYGGNIANLGQPGLGIQVPGPAPTNVLTPSISYAFNVGSSSATVAPSSMTGTSGMSSSGYGSSYSSPSSSSSYSSPSSSSYSSPTSSSSSGYGRRR